MIFHSSFQGLDTLLIDTPKARCEISLFGAQVLSFIPKQDGRDLLWCSPSKLADGRPVRGGIPICWPWFAKQNVTVESAQHGFVRTQLWTLSHQLETGGDIELVFDPPAMPKLPPESSPWPAQCRVQTRIRIGDQLQQELLTHNESDTAVLLTQALHTYFRISDVHLVAVPQLTGLEYQDKLLNFAHDHQQKAWRFQESCDRIYLRTPQEMHIADPQWGRTIRIQSRSSQTTVVWNPGADGVKNFTDIPHSDWPQYLCVEVANCGPHDRIALQPGQSATMSQTLSVL
jgi:glucose-6-phosphate 1-epimerase